MSSREYVERVISAYTEMAAEATLVLVGAAAIDELVHVSQEKEGTPRVTGRQRTPAYAVHLALARLASPT